jgi:hypothetical protein
VSRANPDGRRPMWRQVVRAAWRSRVADMNKVEIGGSEPVLPLLGVHGGEARPPAVMSSRSRQGPGGYSRQPKPASTGRSRGEQLGRVQRSLRQVGRGRVGGSDAVSRAGGRAALPTAREGSHARPRACRHRGPRSPTPHAEGAARRSNEGGKAGAKRAAYHAASPTAEKEGEPRAPQCASPPRTPMTKHAPSTPD